MLVVSIASESEALGLVSIARYRALSGDTATSDDDVAAALTDAVHLVEEYLRRKLTLGEHTESQIPLRGRVYPSCTPIAAVADNDRIEGVAIGLGVCPFKPRAVTFTYTGGYTSATLPTVIALAIVQTARDIAASVVSSSSVPYGAKSLSVGDVSVSFADEGAGVALGGLGSRQSRSIRGYRARYI